MNSFTLMALIIQEPQLRYTSDNQTPVADMLVQFAGLRDEDPPEMLKVVSWNTLAQEMQANYHQGDRVIVEGYLSMTTSDRPEGFKEKRVEMTAQRVHRVDVAHPAAPSARVPAPTPTSAPALTPARKSRKSKASAASVPVAASAPDAIAIAPEVDYDSITF